MQTEHFSFAGEARHRRVGVGFSKIAHAHIGGKERLDVAVVEKSIHAPAVARRVMALGVERHPRRTRRRADATVGTARTATMVPYDDPFAGLAHETVALASGAAGAVIHAVAALPLRLLRALKNVRCSEVRREQAELEPRTGGVV